MGEIDATKLPGIVGAYRLNFKDLIRFILEGLGIYDKTPSKKPKPNESTMENKQEEEKKDVPDTVVITIARVSVRQDDNGKLINYSKIEKDTTVQVKDNPLEIIERSQKLVDSLTNL